MTTPLRVLIVEDSEEDTVLLVLELRRGGYDVVHRRVDTARALSTALEEQEWDVVLSDYILPNFNGLEALRLLQEKGFDLPFIIVSGRIANDTAIEAIKAGAHDYIMKYNLPRLIPAIERGINEAAERRERKKAEQALVESEAYYRTIFETTGSATIIVDRDGAIVLANREFERLSGYGRAELEGKRSWRGFFAAEGLPGLQTHQGRRPEEQAPGPANKEVDFVNRQEGIKNVLAVADLVPGTDRTVVSLMDITELKQSKQALQQSYAKLEQTFDQTVEALVSLVEILDPFTAGHQVRVAQLAGAIASEMNLRTEEQKATRMAALVHDIGKIHIAAAILNKPGPLDGPEWNLIRTHPEIGYEVLKNIDFGSPVAEIVRQHHEAMNGSGYPRGLSRNEILTGAQIVMVANVVEAMVSNRPYCRALPLADALEEIRKHQGVLYDAEVVQACLMLFEKGAFCFNRRNPREPQAG